MPTDEELANRYTYHPPKGDQVERYQVIREEALAFARTIVDLTPASGEQDQALDALDVAVMKANAAIARHE